MAGRTTSPGWPPSLRVPTIFTLAVCANLVAVTAACRVGQESGERRAFGDIDGACGVTVLTNDIGDDTLLREGVDCTPAGATAFELPEGIWLP